MDAWAQQSLPAFIASQDGEIITFRLSGMRTVPVPKDVLDVVMHSGNAFIWESERGYMYSTRPDPVRPMVGCIRSVVLSSPKNPDGDDGLGWRYPVIKMGRGISLWGAIYESLRAEAVEVRLFDL